MIGGEGTLTLVDGREGVGVGLGKQNENKFKIGLSEKVYWGKKIIHLKGLFYNQNYDQKFGYPWFILYIQIKWR